MKTDLAAFEKACREAGVRLTHQRLEIFRELAESSDHPSAEKLHQRLRKRIATLSLDTVYRTLATFESHGLISRVASAESQARFETVRQQHHHLVCSVCREIIDFQWQGMDDLSLPADLANWGRIVQKNVVVHGVCSKCLEKQRTSTAR